MKLEVGKTYRMRNGDTVTIKAFDESANEPYTGVYVKCWHMWQADGSSPLGAKYDLISEVIPPRIMWMNEYKHHISLYKTQNFATNAAASEPIRTAVRVQIIEMPEGGIMKDKHPNQAVALAYWQDPSRSGETESEAWQSAARNLEDGQNG